MASETETKDLMGDSFESRCVRELSISLLQPASSSPGEDTLERRKKTSEFKILLLISNKYVSQGYLHILLAHIIFGIIQSDKYCHFPFTAEDTG